MVVFPVHAWKRQKDEVHRGEVRCSRLYGWETLLGPQFELAGGQKLGMGQADGYLCPAEGFVGHRSSIFVLPSP